MAVPTVCSLSRSLLSRGSLASSRSIGSIFLSSRITISTRQFASSTRFSQDVNQHPSTGSQRTTPSHITPSNRNARGVALFMVSKHAVKSDIEVLFQNAGLQVISVQLRLDRFTFQNDTLCFVELANEQQAREAVEKLNGNTSLGKALVVKPLKEDFVWGINGNRNDVNSLGHYVFHDNAGIMQAIEPILDGRRIHFSVKTPAWGVKGAGVGERRIEAGKVIQRNFSKFGLESIGPILPNFGDLKSRPRFLCFVDFKTKEGAEEAIRTMHDTEVEGKQVWLTNSEIAPWKAYQIGRVDKVVLAELQQKGFAPAVDEQKYSKPYTKKARKARKGFKRE